MYNFDEIIDRRGSRCINVDTLEENFGRADLTSLWVADMDFRTPDFIIDAMKKRLEHPILGYPSTGEDYFPMVSKWVENLHGWKTDPSNFRFIPGIVRGIGFAERCFLSPGDKVVIQPPVYHPFRITTQGCGFEAVFNPLKPIYDDNGYLASYDMDLDGFEALIDEHVKMIVISNPHNPCGICFPVETLRRLADICTRHGIIVVSDEIHAEMPLFGNKHHPFASVSEAAAQCSITFMAPSKTFNIAGIVSSYCIIENPELRERFFAWLEAVELDYPPLFSSLATRAAYTPEGDAWRREMLSYVEGNVDFVCEWLENNLPEVHAVRPQASFLVWLDCRKLGLDQKALVDLFINKAHLALNDGSMFGAPGTGFMRLNVGCPRTKLAGALESLKKAIRG